MEATTIATINFKGGVGKTTVTWCLSNGSAATMRYPALRFDLDAQMSRPSLKLWRCGQRRATCRRSVNRMKKLRKRYIFFR